MCKRCWMRRLQNHCKQDVFPQISNKETSGSINLNRFSFILEMKNSFKCHQIMNANGHVQFKMSGPKRVSHKH